MEGSLRDWEYAVLSMQSVREVVRLKEAESVKMILLAVILLG